VAEAPPRRTAVTWGLTWGVRSSERTASLPCDALRSNVSVQADRAISIAAPPSIVFSWLCQLRVAPYSYDILDNLGRRSPRERNPELVRLEVGQRFMTVFALRSFVDGEQITLRCKGVAVTYRVQPEGAGSRLHARAWFGGHWPVAHVLAWGDLVMMRKQLLTLKSLAEHEAAGAPAYRRQSHNCHEE
jgi:hypothetical protein